MLHTFDLRKLALRKSSFLRIKVLRKCVNWLCVNWFFYAGGFYAIYLDSTMRGIWKFDYFSLTTIVLRVAGSQQTKKT